jgi:hypothetical protein
MDVETKPLSAWTDESKTALRTLWLRGLSAAEIAERLTVEFGLSPPVDAAKIYVTAFRMGLPKRVKTSDGLTAPLLRAPAGGRHPASPREAGYRTCLKCGSKFWSQHAGIRRCPQHKREEE